MKKENRFGVVVVVLFTLAWISMSVWGFFQMKKNSEAPIASMKEIVEK